MDIGSTYNVDICLCIDCTETMDNILHIVKEKALNFYEDIQYNMRKKNKNIDNLRVRVIAFRDYLAYDTEARKKVRRNEPMLMSDFFLLPRDSYKLEISVKGLDASGGGDDPEDGLEALAYAIRSDWDLQAVKKRHIIAIWSDAVPHELGYARSASLYPRGMARDFNELTEWWGDSENYGCISQDAKRLILFTPDEGAWRRISENWDNVAHYPSKAGDGLASVDYHQIISCISNSI